WFSVAQSSRLRVNRASSPCSRVWHRDVVRTRRGGCLRHTCLLSARVRLEDLAPERDGFLSRLPSIRESWQQVWDGAPAAKRTVTRAVDPGISNPHRSRSATPTQPGDMPPPKCGANGTFPLLSALAPPAAR